jgi:hypothetical protein
VSRNILLIVALLPAIPVLYLAATNLAPVALSGLGAPLQVYEAALLVGSYACGLATIGTLWNAQSRRQVKGEQNLVKWEKEDQKLMAEVASDEVKQLKAKIATLETALQNALDRLKKAKDASA